MQLGQCSRKASTYSKSQERIDRQNTLDTSGSAVKNITSFRSHSVNSDTISKINVASTDHSVTCKIDLNKESLQWMPMFFSSKNNSYLMPTTNQIAQFKGTSKQKRIKTKKKPYRPNDEMIDGPSRWLTIEEKDDVFAICPGTRFRVINSEKKHIQCIGGKLVEINNERKSNDVKKSVSSLDKTTLFDLSCAKSIKESILTTEQRCGPPTGHGRLSHIGWSWEKEETDSSFTSQVTVCHDQETENTYYTNHTIFGPSIDAKKRGKSRQIPFKEGGKQFYASSSAANAYKISSQRNLFARLLPKEKERSKIFFPGNLESGADSSVLTNNQYFIRIMYFFHLSQVAKEIYISQKAIYHLKQTLFGKNGKMQLIISSMLRHSGNHLIMEIGRLLKKQQEDMPLIIESI